MFLLDFVLKKPAQELFALVHKQFGWFAAASGGEEETVDTSIGQTPSHKICIGAWDVSCMLESDALLTFVTNLVLSFVLVTKSSKAVMSLEKNFEIEEAR